MPVRVESCLENADDRDALLRCLAAGAVATMVHSSCERGAKRAFQRARLLRHAGMLAWHTPFGVAAACYELMIVDRQGDQSWGRR